ncbi:hypothetical protein C9374_005549 [Naegleria lovaniensis]|uniref:Amino acid transporter transmembrane domain-containing protein n=1 Tax=Naegleria lovaniensis TaxID=51637 RepID=A0AA88GPY5_NAELO|nr:uncharacterized protein C9374_005549 [Naegleria lovaniensis]KAG2382347.1 hypothetical protein C9374_005549 [Naegleria lovaniensis]
MSSLDHQTNNEDDSLQQSLLSQPVPHGDAPSAASINNVDKEYDTHPLEKIRKRSSGTISTIFSIINTMVGSTILSLAWGFTQSGLYLGIIVFVLVGLISYYTCNLVVQHSLFKVRYDDEGQQQQQQTSPNETTAINSGDKIALSEEESSAPTTYYQSVDNKEGSTSLRHASTTTRKKVKRISNYILDIKDFSQVCVEHLGRWSEILCIITSIVILIGASIAYHIFMKDCLMSIVTGIFDIQYDTTKIYPWDKNGPPWYWNGIFASVIIVVLLFPITLLKNLNFLVKFNSFGIFFVLFLIIFIIYASIEAMVSPFEFSNNIASVSTLTMMSLSSNVSNIMTSSSMNTNSGSSNGDSWMNHLLGGILSNSFAGSSNALSTSSAAPGQTSPPQYNFADDTIVRGDTVLVNHLSLFNIHFSHLLAILSLSFFIHNVIGPILKNQKSLKHTKRDTAVAFIVAALIYAVPGMLGAFAFRFSVTIQQNFLNQFPNNSVYANISRGAVLFQLMSIYPLLLSVIRVQCFSFLYRKNPNKEKQQYPGILQVAALNFVVCLITTSMAAFYPMVGTVLRFTGAICGLIYMYLLPVSIHLVVQYKKKQLTVFSVVFNVSLVLLGLSILVLQFIDFDQLTNKTPTG